MVFAFVYPLVLGVGMYLLIRLIPTSRVPGLLPATIYHFGVGMITVRSIFIGVLKIYGTTNVAMTTAYTIISFLIVPAMVIIYLVIIIMGAIKKEKSADEK